MYIYISLFQVILFSVSDGSVAYEVWSIELSIPPCLIDSDKLLFTYRDSLVIYPFKPFIHYKPRIAVAILDL